MNASIMVSVPKKSILDIANKFGSITVADVEGSVLVQAQFGSIELTRCANVEAKNSFGSTTLGAIKGAFKVESKNGKVRAYDVPGGEITNAFGAIEVSDASGPVSLLGRMGSITAKNIPGGRIQNSYGSTTVTLVRDFSGVIEAKTRFGDVDSDYALQPRNNNPADWPGLPVKGRPRRPSKRRSRPRAAQAPTPSSVVPKKHAAPSGATPRPPGEEPDNRPSA